MIDGATTDGSTEDASEVARLERRWQREREARLEAEQLAESGLRSLWEAKNDLDRRVEERTAELVRTQALAQASERAKTRFLADLAHQVRTPLQTILAAIELATPATPQDRDRLSVAADATVELRDLFTNLMRLAELQVNPPPPRPTEVDLRDVADDLTTTWRERMLSRGLLLVPHADGRAVVDPDRLAQAADALLDNAVRFAVPGPVELHLNATPDGVRLRVVDSGPGLAGELLEAAFVPFTTFGGASTGGGIGLALVRELAFTAGGRATATSGHGDGPGRGLSVEVLLPADGGQTDADTIDRRVGSDRRRTVHSAPTEGEPP